MSSLRHAMSDYFSNIVHHHHQESPIVYHSSSLDVWPSELVDKPDRFVEKIETLSAHTMTPGHDGCLTKVDRHHCHTFFRVTLAVTADLPAETIYVERVLAQKDVATHSIIPISVDTVSSSAASDDGDTLYDHACIILEGTPATLIHADHFKEDRVIEFYFCPDRQLSLYEFATLLRFVSKHGLRAVSLGMDTACETYSRWFCRASWYALTKVMPCAAWHYIPPKTELENQIASATASSTTAWLRSTFADDYPADDVAAENLTRQLNAMNEEEREKKLDEMARREEAIRHLERIWHDFQVGQQQLRDRAMSSS